MPSVTGPRHPLCPYCHYDLVATVEAGRRICPECGESFELGELIREPRPGDWTEMVGVRRLAIAMLIRGAIAMGIWTAWLAILNWEGQQPILIGIVALMLHLLVGGVIGMVFWTRLREKCGFDGLFPAVVACIAVLIVLSLGGAVIGQLTPLSGNRIAFGVVSAGLTAISYIIVKAILDD